jgi:superfamily I DNA/RNA helicase
VSDREDYVALRTLFELRAGVGIATATQIADAAITSDLNYRDIFYEALPEDTFSGRNGTALANAREICELLLEWNDDDTIADRSDDLDDLLQLILGAPPGDWRTETEALPDGATIGEMRRYLAAEKDDERANALAAVYQRLGEPVTPEEALPNRVRIMTMHGAKGLSARVVFIPGLEEELLPGENRIRFPGQVMEAARMLYVSITRARLACVLSYARGRFQNGTFQSHRPSRFTSDIGTPFRPCSGGITDEVARQAVEAATHL